MALPFSLQAAEAGGEIQKAQDTLAALWSSVVARLPIVGIGLLVFLGFLLAAKLVRRTLSAAGARTRLDPALVLLFGRLAGAAVVVLGFFVAAVVVFPAFKPGDLVAGLGITSVALGFALKDVLQNFVAGVLLLYRRPFRVGDQIRTGQHEGTVERLDVRSTRIRTYDDELIVVPNGDVYTSAVVVKTAYGKRRVRFVVAIGYDDDIDRARGVIQRVLRETEGVCLTPEPWVYASELAPSSVNLAVYFWTDAYQSAVLRVSDRVATGIKRALDEAGIEIPYPHVVVTLPGEAAQPGAAAGAQGAPRSRLPEAASRGARRHARPSAPRHFWRMHRLKSSRQRGPS